ncbi:hypothetical protein Tco_0007264 [Tanacetum coccineum]
MRKRKKKQGPLCFMAKSTNLPTTTSTSSNTTRANQDNTLRINRGTRYDNQRTINVAQSRENVEEAKIQLSTEQVDWRDDTNDELEDQELEAHYLYMAQIQEVTPDAANNSGPIFDAEPLQKMSTNGDQADHDDDDLA